MRQLSRPPGHLSHRNKANIGVSHQWLNEKALLSDDMEQGCSKGCCSRVVCLLWLEAARADVCSTWRLGVVPQLGVPPRAGGTMIMMCDSWN